MNRSFLENLGITKENIDSIMAENGKDIETAKAPIAGLNDQITALKATISERDTQLDDLKKNAGDIDALKNQIAELQESNANKAKEYEAQIKAVKVSAAVEKALGEAGAKNGKAVKAFLDLDNAEIADDGTIKGLAKQIDTLKADESTSFLFKDAGGAAGATSFKGVQINNGLGTPPDTDSYAVRLTKAREAGNTLEAISIKSEAADNGVYLM